MHKYSIGIVHENNAQMAQFSEYLIGEGFNVIDIKSGSGLERVIGQSAPDILLLPIEMGSTNGIDLCYQLKNRSDTANVFVILLSDRKEEFTQIAGLESGADDFLYVTIQERVLLSRIKALLKRKKWKKADISDQTIVIDEERYLILKEGMEVYLPKKEFEILNLLYSKPNKVFSREEIKYKIWNNMEEVRGRTVDVHVRNIREKIGAQFIKTVKGVGYSLEM